MKRFLTALALGLTLTAPAMAAGPIYVDGTPIDTPVHVQHSTTYVALRPVAEALLEQVAVNWEGDHAAVYAKGLELTATPGTPYLEANGRFLYIPLGILLESGRTLVPIRVLASALGATVEWDAATGRVSVTSSGEGIPTAGECYDPDALLWLSRIISAESQGEPLVGKIAVGNVVLNRVTSQEYPNTIYGVIFDQCGGEQFQPVSNGTVYLDPTPESIAAAKMVLEGADVAGDSLYFLAPALTNNHWIMENREHVITIGAHWFYR